jgi:transcriptional regulator with XRE-family HTH domain
MRPFYRIWIKKFCFKEGNRMTEIFESSISGSKGRKIYKVVFAEQLKVLRNKHKLNQTALGKILNLTSMQISRYENGSSFPSFDVLMNLADYFNISIDWLVGYENIKIMERTADAIDLATIEFKKEYGKDATIKEGEKFVTVFNNGVLILSKKKGKIIVKVSLGKPYLVDSTIDLLEDVECKINKDGDVE